MFTMATKNQHTCSLESIVQPPRGETMTRFTSCPTRLFVNSCNCNTEMEVKLFMLETHHNVLSGIRDDRGQM